MFFARFLFAFSLWLVSATIRFNTAPTLLQLRLIICASSTVLRFNTVHKTLLCLLIKNLVSTVSRFHSAPTRLQKQLKTGISLSLIYNRYLPPRRFVRYEQTAYCLRASLFRRMRSRNVFPFLEGGRRKISYFAMTSREKTISSVVKNLFTMTDYMCLLPFFSQRSERKQPEAKNGGDGEGGLRFERRADYLP